MKIKTIILFILLTTSSFGTSTKFIGNKLIMSDNLIETNFYITFVEKERGWLAYFSFEGKEVSFYCPVERASVSGDKKVVTLNFNGGTIVIREQMVVLYKESDNKPFVVFFYEESEKW